MKNIFKTILASMLLVTSCATDTELEVAPTAQSNKFYASIEAPATRTYADEDGKLLWNANDEITLFQGNAYPRQFQFKGETGKNYGEFEEINPPTGVISANPLEANYAIYPYAANTTISNQGQISYTIPAVQPYAKDSFGLGANPMVAVTKNTTDNFLAFKNLCGYFEFSLYGDITVKSIEFKGNNNEKLAGAVTITATNQDDPTFVFADGATETITLDCGDGVSLGADAANATKFWFVVPATTYAEGITITITDTEGKKMTKSTSKSITVERSTIQPLNAFLVTTENDIPNNKIYYTTTDGNVITPYSQSFGATITSNVYENGKGIITFEGDVLYLGASVFYNCTTLSGIIMPNSASVVGDSAFQGCQNLTSVVLSNSLTSINTNAFFECKNLAKINIPESVKEIKKSAFAKCSCLTNVNIPQNVNLIGKTAFTECVLLSSVTIGSNVTNIDEDAFCYCKNLSTVYCKPQNPPTLTNSQYGGAFYNCASNLIIYVPTTSVDTYKAANGWKDYADKIEGYTF
ncbi:MAG: leucine-rich repeat domain-containing protein [Alistipes sp.]|nr:leucine-rich repeat domain-containing protein [Alistipes sp.]